MIRLHGSRVVTARFFVKTYTGYLGSRTPNHGIYGQVFPERFQTAPRNFFGEASAPPRPYRPPLERIATFAERMPTFSEHLPKVTVLGPQILSTVFPGIFLFFQPFVMCFPVFFCFAFLPPPKKKFFLTVF